MSVCHSQTNQNRTDNKGCGTFLYDKRNGKNYKTVLIGKQCWMAENLNIGKMLNTNENIKDTANFSKDNGILEKFCFDNDSLNCNKYGALFQWDEMMQYTRSESCQGICPDGWHIPAAKEWHDLIASSGGYLEAGGHLKGKTEWNDPNTGADNSTGFTALGTGRMVVARKVQFTEKNYFTNFWSSTPYENDYGWAYILYYNTPYIDRYNIYKKYALHVRCLKNENNIL
ncbi:MAG: hypothetical protein NTW49_06995 [Bacteroidia bacterium]|nr:hypothetical protein [Bacteroidia bacterium]